VHVTKASAVLLKTKKEQHRHSLTMNQIVFWGKNQSKLHVYNHFSASKNRASKGREK
jgi:alpha-ketoglutarate-dependent taurine dioxygenase